MDYTEIYQKLESAFNKTNIQKYDVCQLWSCLSCDHGLLLFIVLSLKTIPGLLPFFYPNFSSG